ncbi:MAG: K(+)-transporting ATPase subunit F [Chloroflexota bacterium]
MDLEHFIGAVIVVILIVYLAYVLVLPERF